MRKAEDGPYLGFSCKSLISDPLISGKRSQRKILQIGKFNKTVVSDFVKNIPADFNVSFSRSCSEVHGQSKGFNV